jgi:hypothetical protein
MLCDSDDSGCLTWQTDYDCKDYNQVCEEDPEHQQGADCVTS